MRSKILKFIDKTYFNLTNIDKKHFEDIVREDGLSKCRPIFHLKAFLFGWFYLLYRKMTMESFGVLIASLMVGYLLAYAKIHPILVLIIMLLINSLLSGFCYYFLYINKLNRDIDFCKEDIECIKQKAKPSIINVTVAIVFIVLLIWPWIYALITGNRLQQ